MVMMQSTALIQVPLYLGNHQIRKLQCISNQISNTIFILKLQEGSCKTSHVKNVTIYSLINVIATVPFRPYQQLYMLFLLVLRPKECVYAYKCSMINIYKILQINLYAWTSNISRISICLLDLFARYYSDYSEPYQSTKCFMGICKIYAISKQ